MLIRLGYTPLGAVGIDEEGFEALRRMQGRGGYSDDEGSLRLRELKVWGSMASVPRQAALRVRGNLFASGASELLQRHEERLRVPNNAARTREQRQAHAALYEALPQPSTLDTYVDLAEASEVTTPARRGIGTGPFASGSFVLESPPDSETFQGGNSFSSLMMVRIDELPPEGSARSTLFRKLATAGPEGGWEIALSERGDLFASIRATTGALVTANVSGLCEGRIYAIAFSWDAANLSLVAVDLEGGLVFDQTSSSLQYSPPGTNDCSIGARADGTEAFTGIVFGLAYDGSNALGLLGLYQACLAVLFRGGVASSDLIATEALHLGEDLIVNQLGSSAFAYSATPPDVGEHVTDRFVRAADGEWVEEEDAHPDTGAHVVFLLREDADYPVDRIRRALDVLSRMLPARSLGQHTREGFVADQVVANVLPEWNGSAPLDATALGQRRLKVRTISYDAWSTISSAVVTTGVRDRLRGTTAFTIGKTPAAASYESIKQDGLFQCQEGRTYRARLYLEKKATAFVVPEIRFTIGATNIYLGVNDSTGAADWAGGTRPVGVDAEYEVRIIGGWIRVDIWFRAPTAGDVDAQFVPAFSLTPGGSGDALLVGEHTVSPLEIQEVARIPRTPSRVRDYGPLTLLRAADLNAMQDAALFGRDSAGSWSGAWPGGGRIRRSFKADASGLSTVILALDDDTDWRDRMITIVFAISSSDIRPPAGSGLNATTPTVVQFYSGTGGSSYRGLFNGGSSFFECSLAQGLALYNGDAGTRYVVGMVAASGQLGER
jgi:hypothetical protein